MDSPFGDSSLFPRGTPRRGQTWFDRLISFVSPRRGAMRAAWREAETHLQSIGGTRGYRSAVPTRAGDDQAGSGGADYHLEAELHRLRIIERARKLARDNAIAAGLIARITDYVVGSGPKPQARTDDQKWNEEAEAFFNSWASEPIDTRRLFTFRDVLRLAIQGWARDGEFFVIPLPTGAVLLVEADRVSAPPSLRYSWSHVGGIDLDPTTGAPTKYYVAPYRGDEYFNASVTEFPERDVYDAKWVLHLARRERPSQTHGLSIFSSSAGWFEQLERYIEAEIMSARMAACIGLLITSSAPMSGLSTLIGKKSGTTFPRFDMEPGMVRELAPGEAVTQVDPKRPINGFGEFVTQFSRILGCPTGTPIELIMLDFSRGSYSSVRGALTQAQRAMEAPSHSLEESILRPLWNWKIEQGMAAGALRKNTQYKRHGWVNDPYPTLDPIKEIQAEMMEVDAGFKTYSEALANHGRDFDDFLKQREDEERRIEAAGLSFSRSSATRNPNPGNQAPEPAPVGAPSTVEETDEE